MATYANPTIERSPSRVLLATRLAVVALARRRLTIVLLLVVPALFDLVVLATTGSRPLPIEVAVLSGESAQRIVDDRALTLVFMGTAAVSFLACYLAFHVAGKRRDVDARLVLAGYRPAELLASKLLVLVGFAIVMAAYETAMLWPWLTPHSTGSLAVGFFLGGLVYGCIGLLIGAAGVRELEGIFLIVLLSNVDAGWLQNPVYYASSDRRWLIEALPGHGPAQLAILGALTDASASRPVLLAFAHAGAALVVAVLLFARRLSPCRR